MGVDSEKIGGGDPDTKKDSHSNEDFSLRDLFCSNYKFYGFMSAIFLFLRSDVFQDNVLGMFKGTTDYRGTTAWGELVTLLGFLFLIIMVQVLLKLNFV